MVEPFNAAEWLVDRQVAAGNGDRTAVRSGGRTLTYAELARESAAVAAALAALGVRPEERAMFAMVDGVELLAGVLGTIRSGAVAVPVSTMLNGDELAKILRDSRARVLFVSPEFADAGQVAVRSSPHLAAVVLADDPVTPTAFDVPAGVSLVRWPEFVAAAGSDLGTAAADTEEDSPALWLYTSGTTGTPKAAMHRHANFRHTAETYGAQVLGIRPDDVCLSVAKLFFAYGLGNSMTFPLSVGAATVLEPARPTPESVSARLIADRPTLFFGVPTFYAALLAAEPPREIFSSVRLAASAGEALPAPLYQRFTSYFGVELLDGIGSTEALHIFLSNQPGAVRPGTSGTPVPGYQVQLRDEAGGQVPTGEPGALYVRGESIATGYWCRTETTRRVFQGEWLRTGDTYVESDDGYYTCLGRSDDLLKAGGIWVSPAEVEARLLEHPTVAEVAVVGLTDETGLDKPVAVVVGRPAQRPDPAELVEWCRAGLAAFKRPRHVVIVDELPKTATGKLQRFKVRELAAGSLGTAARPDPPHPEPVEVEAAGVHAVSQP